MKKTILFLALAAGLTSFAGNANAEIINLSVNQSTLWTLLYVPSNGNGVSDSGAQAPGFFGLDMNGNGIQFESASSMSMFGMVFSRPEQVRSGNANFMSMTSFLTVGTTISSASTFLDPFSSVYPSSSANQQYVGLEAVGRNKEFYYGWASFTDLGGIMTLNDAAFNTTAGSSIIVGQTTLQSVPEPSTYALFGIGAIGLLMVMRRKKAA